MRKILLFVVYFWLYASTIYVSGQSLTPKNSLRIGVDATSLGGINGIGPHYQVRYARHLFSDRIVTALSTGYFHRTAYQYGGAEIFTGQNTYRRFSLDLSFLMDLLPSNKSALRIGGGISHWFRSDRILTGGSYSIYPSGEIYNIKTTWTDINSANIGYHISAEYEKNINAYLAINGKINWINITTNQLFHNMENSGYAYQGLQAGLGLVYKF